MCGVFGFVAKQGRQMDVQQIKRIAVQTETRGHHAFGFAWIDKEGRLKAYKQTGRISDSLALLNMAKDARMLVGHCRYATHGSYSNNLNNHPHPCDGGWIVHNGVVSDHREIVRRHRLHPVTECDSEVLGLLIESVGGSMADRARWAVNQTRESPLVLLGLWKHPRRLVAVRRGNPLFMGVADEGTYLGSCSDDLPGTLRKVLDGRVLEFRQSEPVQAYVLAESPASRSQPAGSPS